MAENDSVFKVTDRRKFNPDGTPRENAPDPVSTAESAVEAQPPKQEGEAASNGAPNVVSSPGEAARERQDAQKRSPHEAAPSQAPGQSQKSTAAERAYEDSNSGRSSRLPEASFFSMVNMLAVEAAMHLGLMEGPEGRTAVDLDSARHMIDMLGLLQQKTRGNLTAQEDNLLENVLADLRIKFVALSRGR